MGQLDKQSALLSRGAAWAACLCQDGLRLDSGVVKVAVPSRMRAIPARMSGPLAASGPAGASWAWASWPQRV